MNAVEALARARHAAWGLPEVGRVVLVTPSYDTSRHVVALVFGRQDLQAVIKIARRPHDTEGLRTEADALTSLERHRGRAPDVARLLEITDVAGCPAMVQSAVHGRPLGPEVVRRDPQAALRSGAAFVQTLPVTGDHAPGWYAPLVATPVERLLEAFPVLAADDLAGRTHAALSPLAGTVLPAVFEHGDLSHPNVLDQGQGRIGAVDLERAVEQGLPGHDLVFFATYVAEAVTGAASLPERLSAYDAALLREDGWARPVVIEHLALRGLAPDLLPLVLLLTAVRAACTLRGRLLGSGAQELEHAEHAAAVAVRDRDVVLWRHVLEHLERVAA